VARLITRHQRSLRRGQLPQFVHPHGAKAKREGVTTTSSDRPAADFCAGSRPQRADSAKSSLWGFAVGRRVGRRRLVPRTHG
jgi:hypothetical protein